MGRRRSGRSPTTSAPTPSTRRTASSATAPLAPRKPGRTSKRCATGARCLSLPRVRIDNLSSVESFTTLDGSEIRELAGQASGNAVNQSLAEATVQPGGETIEHYHRTTEEIYFFTHGSGRMRLGD